MSYVGSLVSNPHELIGLPDEWEADNVVTVKGVYDYFHYKCDGFDDVGWGCGYRTLQTICSWILRCKKSENPQGSVPSILSVQKILVDIGDKPKEFLGSRDWIGSLEVGYTINSLYGVDFRILHVTGNCDWKPHISKLTKHFEDGGSPVMMGGKTDAASKCVIGTHGDDHLLILDPHLTGKASSTRSLLSWCSTVEFPTSQNNFYNLCVPQINWE